MGTAWWHCGFWVLPGMLPEAGTPGPRMRGRTLCCRNEGRLRPFCGTLRGKLMAKSQMSRSQLTEDERAGSRPGVGCPWSHLSFPGCCSGPGPAPQHGPCETLGDAADVSDPSVLVSQEPRREDLPCRVIRPRGWTVPMAWTRGSEALPDPLWLQNRNPHMLF